MQVPVLGCTFLTLSESEKSTAKNLQLSEQGSVPIIRALMISSLMIGAQQCHPPVPPTCATQQCHTPVPSSATHIATSQCPVVVPVSAQQLHQSMPSSAAYQCCLSVPPISAAYP
ncbi:unnamed protein product [Staurois parvus]|uniref:Uncharacterized protein n=1 Tax=Staurois parvus TaxID=386267 RepID=A0ABN9AS71_9NEOB|nr:unnamed protein product [Staurois parvus]